MKVRFSFFHHLANFLVIGTGIAFGYAKYLVPPADPYSNVGNSWEPFFHDTHVWVVPLLVFAVGMLWQHHILPGLRHPKLKSRGLQKVISGFGLFSVLVPMVGTGYLIQTAVDEHWRKTWIWVHVITSAIWTLSYLIHILKVFRKPQLYQNQLPP